MMRLFIATELPASIMKTVTDLRGRLDPGGDCARWVRPGSIHLTLKFLGEVSPDRTARIDQELRRIRRPAFKVSVSGVGFFPSEASPRVFWLGVFSPGLEELAGDIETRMVELGFPSEKRAFAPHLTLARAPTRRRIDRPLVRNARELAETDFGTFLVERFCLFQSVLKSSGAVYTILRSYDLPASHRRERPAP